MTGSAGSLTPIRRGIEACETAQRLIQELGSGAMSRRDFASDMTSLASTNPDLPELQAVIIDPDGSAGRLQDRIAQLRVALRNLDGNP